MGESLKRIMVVEDEPVVALDLEGTLERLGYSVVAQTDTGEDAVLLAGSVRPDLVLMDIHLHTKTDGIEAAEIIYSRFQIPVIFVRYSFYTAAIFCGQIAAYGERVHTLLHLLLL